MDFARGERRHVVLMRDQNDRHAAGVQLLQQRHDLDAGARVERTRRLGCPLGLYNHGGWGGEPENLVAVCEFLRRRHDAPHVGSVYNQHHGHDH